MRAVLVTGASSGIGRATALELARAGYRAFAGVRSEEDADSLRAEAAAGLDPVLLDVAEDASVRRAALRVSEAAGAEGLYGLVNNAGISAPGSVECLDLDDIRKVFEVNVLGAVRTVQACLPLLRQARGRIVHIGSGEAFLATPINSAYCMSKYALEALSESLRMELAPLGLPVILVEPGGTRTRIMEKVEDRFRTLEDSLAPGARGLYAESIEARRRMPERGTLQPPEVVAKTVRRALDASRPRARYFAGADVRGAFWLGRFTPAPLRDGIMRAVLGFPKAAGLSRGRSN